MKISVETASDMILDYLVAICEGWTYLPIVDTFKTGRVFHMMKNADGDNYVPLFSLQYSKDWKLAGPIIEQEMRKFGFDLWAGVREINPCAATYTSGGTHECVYGSTPLIAAMRCYVMNKLGKEVEIPDSLFQES